MSSLFFNFFLALKVFRLYIVVKYQCRFIKWLYKVDTKKKYALALSRCFFSVKERCILCHSISYRVILQR